LPPKETAVPILDAMVAFASQATTTLAGVTYPQGPNFLVQLRDSADAYAQYAAAFKAAYDTGVPPAGSVEFGKIQVLSGPSRLAFDSATRTLKVMEAAGTLSCPGS